MPGDPLTVVRELSRLLSTEAPAPDELRRQADGSGLFDEVEVDDDEPPELVELELVDGVRLTTNDLAGALGEAHPLPTLPDRPSRVAFYVEEAGQPARVAVIASLDDEDENRVVAVTLRRDEL